MIILRNKKFSNWTPLPDPLYGEDPEVVEKYGVHLKLVIQRTDAFNRTYSKHVYGIKKIIDGLIDDIKKDGQIYSDGVHGGDTHSLGTKTKKGELHHLMSKDIDWALRLVYRVHPPRLFVDEETGELRYEMKIVLDECGDHVINGKGSYVKKKIYSEIA